MKVVICSNSEELGKSIANRLNVRPSPVQISRFADGEMNVRVTDDLFNQEVYVIQSISSPVNDSLMEFLLMVDAIKRVGAKKITAVISYYGYSRQDRIIKDNHMSSALSAKLVAEMIETAGVDRVIVIDLHSSQIEGFFNIPITNVNCFEVFVEFLSQLVYGSGEQDTCTSIKKEDLVIVAPDIGAVGKARAFAKAMEARYDIELSDKIVVVDKYREKAGVSQVMNIIGKVANKICVIIDDIVDSGGTLCNAASALKGRGTKFVIACITHGVLSGNAVERICSSALDKLVITDTIFPKFTKNGKIEVVPIANVLADFILRR
ncbi:MAG TPA: ribose-phosphate pyrophosphokinase [Wolbachia sp.]|uniref:ribose-phosphate diphosphokinase n=1 Tax=Wolbachia endosymbiont of Pentalonia nigronervosa TaxID=1301914 RepID=UPI000EDB3C0F|nr:ribose-phosphate diphosphokinase [Wolbachia endosymbiont of Pentalonia nigronervosa]MBD0391527.1 ribose-phosphate diphosphokinase [Wolbachia endosymbiont of Pentalonia nigronervosa]HCE59483.1 ribose-phosphate pyrophosphokinase [Wolbachia sp.]